MRLRSTRLPLLNNDPVAHMWYLDVVMLILEKDMYKRLSPITHPVGSSRLSSSRLLQVVSYSPKSLWVVCYFCYPAIFSNVLHATTEHLGELLQAYCQSTLRTWWTYPSCLLVNYRIGKDWRSCLSSPLC